MPRDQNIALVTGANGFVARNLIRSLVHEGWRVIGVSRKKVRNNACSTLTWAEFWSGNALDPKQIRVLFHLAAHIPSKMEDSAHASACLKTNALLTLKLAEYIALHSKARFIHCSSGQVYRYQKRAVTEQGHVLPLHRACFYLASKLLSEIYVERTRNVLGLDAITFRVGSCYGPWMPERSLVARFVTLALKRQPLPLRHGGKEQFDLVHVDDVVTFMMRAAIAEPQGIFNSGSGRGVTVRHVAEAVNRVFDNSAGVVCEEPCAFPLRPGFAPLAMRRTITAFGCKPRNLSKGLEDFRSWLETRPTA